MTKGERWNAIMKRLGFETAASILELSRDLDVSPMTVRRDLAALAREGKVRVLYGSAMLHPDLARKEGDAHYSLNAAGAEHAEEKRRIGKAAAALAEPGDSLIVDCGSTTEYVARYLPEDEEYTVLCYSLNVVSELVRRSGCRTHFSGGLFHENTLMFESPEGLEAIRHFRANKAYLSASGVDARFGVTCSNAYERETKKAVIQSSLRKILVVDSSKFGAVRPAYFADLADFDEIVTDPGIPDEYRRIAEERGIRLTVV